jgi:glycosyltransferase involved in cell wall biosynthesis
VTRLPTYAAVTPARDEEENLRRLGASLTAQTVLPEAWVIVENGSADGTLDVARDLAARHSWISVIQTAASEGYDRTSPYMRAFHAGVAALAGAGEIVVKLDADVSVDPGFFEGVLEAFRADPTLGIASGTCLEERDGEWREWILLGDHCWGPTRSYRRACLDVVLPLDDGIGYASIDEMKAHLAGFRSRTLRHLPFRHHRRVGAGEGGRWKSWEGQGAAAHYTRYRFSYLLARCVYRMRSDPYAAALVTGYLKCAVRRRPQYQDASVLDALREQQRARHFAAAIRGRMRQTV